LVLRHELYDERQVVEFDAQLRPGSALRRHRVEWIVVEVRESRDGLPEVVCRPASEEA
jgi:hypothetical protein